MSGLSGKILLIANPAAQNGRGGEAARYAIEKLSSSLATSSNIELVFTARPKEASVLAENASAYDSVIALGGDGVIHEVVNGLMRLPEPSRPALGVIPAGSGNDYARTLGMSLTLDKAIPQLLSSRTLAYDLGICNGEYFVETLSFGLDAAIALDTVERRKKTTKTGTALFLESGFDVLFHHMRSYEYKVWLDKKGVNQGNMFMLAVQIGKTYGGGFNICPEALPDDGLFDICITHPPLNIPKAVLIFLLAKNGHHTRFKQFEFLRAKKLKIEFAEEGLPIQMDGEKVEARYFDIACVHQALRVLVPR